MALLAPEPAWRACRGAPRGGCGRPCWSRRVTGMSPMQLAAVMAPSAEENFSSQGRTLISALRCGVRDPVHPESTAPKMMTEEKRSVRAPVPRSSAAVSLSEAMRTHACSASSRDGNPIAERIIGLISETAVAIKDSTDAPIRLWPWLIAYAVEWHNSTVSSVGSSSADANISPHQRLTGRPPRVMDLASFGSRAVVLKPPTHQHKPSLSPRGWIGSFLGRSRYSKGGYDDRARRPEGRHLVKSLCLGFIESGGTAQESQLLL